MTSKAESIAATVYTALTTPAMTSVPADRVFRDLNDALATGVFPAVVVEMGDEDQPESGAIGWKRRRVYIDVTVLASGSNPYTTADDAVVESFGRIFADRTLGGYAWDVQEGATRRERAGLESNVGAVRKTYLMQYDTTDGSLS